MLGAVTLRVQQAGGREASGQGHHSCCMHEVTWAHRDPEGPPYPSPVAVTVPAPTGPHWSRPQCRPASPLCRWLPVMSPAGSAWSRPSPRGAATGQSWTGEGRSTRWRFAQWVDIQPTSSGKASQAGAVGWAGCCGSPSGRAAPPPKEVRMRPQDPSCALQPATVSTGSAGNFLRRKVLGWESFEKL